MPVAGLTEAQGVIRIVGVSEMAVSSREDETLVTYSLGSCLGLSLYDPKARVGGIIHCMLPLSKIDPDKARAFPCMFADTGVPLLLQSVFNLGAERKRLIARVAGGARLFDEKGRFRIGERNYTITRKVLWKNSILIASEAMGGVEARTMSLSMATGVTTIRGRGWQTEL